MKSEGDPPETSKEVSRTAESRQPEPGGANGTARQDDVWPFEGPRPPKLTREEIESLLKLWDQEDDKRAAEGLREILEGRGYNFLDFLPELKRAAGIND